ncbi:MAG: hypothetical protein EZS28_030886, partial [Streblomastix strix]
NYIYGLDGFRRVIGEPNQNKGEGDGEYECEFG